MRRSTNTLKLVTSVTCLVIACCPPFAHAAPMIGDRYTMNFSGMSMAHAEFALGNQLADGNFLVEDFEIRIIGNRWNPADMLQGFYNTQVNRLVNCLDSDCTQYSYTVSESQLRTIVFGTINGWDYHSPPLEWEGVGGDYNVNPVPTNGTYAVALNALSCRSSFQRRCDFLLSSGAATFAVGSQLTAGNYEIQRLAVELGLFFFAPDMLQGFYNAQFNRLVACLDAACIQYSGTESRSQFGSIGFANYNEWNFRSALGNFEEARGTYAITAIPEASTYAMMMAGLSLLGIVARRRKQQATV